MYLFRLKFFVASPRHKPSNSKYKGFVGAFDGQCLRDPLKRPQIKSCFTWAAHEPPLQVSFMVETVGAVIFCFNRNGYTTRTAELCIYGSQPSIRRA